MTDKSKLILELTKAYNDSRCSDYKEPLKAVLDMLESDNKGEWIDNGSGSYTCSNCKTEWTTSQIEKMCFCPTCGNPKLRGVSE